jgi:hypothetical protein
MCWNQPNTFCRYPVKPVLLNYMKNLWEHQLSPCEITKDLAFQYRLHCHSIAGFIYSQYVLLQGHIYRQPGLPCTHESMQKVKSFQENNLLFLVLMLPLRLSISQNLEVTRFQGGPQTKLWTFKVIWTFCGACSYHCCASVICLTKNFVKQKCSTGNKL